MEITGFTPGNGGPGTVVTLSLTGMPKEAKQSSTQVTLGELVMGSVDEVSVESDGSGTVTVTIEDSSQSGQFTVIVFAKRMAAARSSQVFTVPQPPGRATITSIFPREVPAGKLSTVTLTGSDLKEEEIMYVSVGSTRASSFVVFDSTRMRFLVMVPPGTLGPLQVALAIRGRGTIYSPVRLGVASGVTTVGEPPGLGVISPEAVVAAWADLAPWIQERLPALAENSSLPSESRDVGDIGACSGLNQHDDHSTAMWGSDGDATATLSSLKISALIGVRIEPAVTVDSTTVQLPLSYSQLEVSGSYTYGQPCALYDLGKKTTTTTTNGKGSVTQTISAGSLCYVAKLGGTVTLSSVVVNGNPSVSVRPDSDGLPDWLVKITSFFQTFDEAAILRSSLQNVFLTADFSQQMIGLLNQKIGS
jgi:hypothetical protein